MAANIATASSGVAGAYKGSAPPDDTECTWIYTGSASNTYGVSNKALVPGAMYYNEGTDPSRNWKPVKSVWS